MDRVSRSEAETEQLGALLAPLLEPGDVIALDGPLGAGKTRFVAGLARGLAAPARVRSPTFTLVNEYAGRVALLHVDLYRIESREIGGLALEERLGDAVLAVEWADKLPAGWLEDALIVRLAPGEGDDRSVRAEARGARAAALLGRWERAVAGVA